MALGGIKWRGPTVWVRVKSLGQMAFSVWKKCLLQLMRWFVSSHAWSSRLWAWDRRTFFELNWLKLQLERVVVATEMLSSYSINYEGDCSWISMRRWIIHPVQCSSRWSRKRLHIKILPTKVRSKCIKAEVPIDVILLWIEVYFLYILALLIR
jgi:hypothetical protein